MDDSPYKVTIVVDPQFGNRLQMVADETPVWIADTPVNRAAAEIIWSQRLEPSHTNGITTFRVEPNSAPEEWCASILGVVDLHHGEYSHQPSYSIVEVIGTPLTWQLRRALRNMD